MENVARRDTIGSTEPIHARFELLPRGTYTYNVPADLRALNNGPRVSMDKYEQMVRRSIRRKTQFRSLKRRARANMRPM